MTALDPRLEATRPIRLATLRRLRTAAPRHRRRLDPYAALALVLLVVGVALVLALPYVGRWVG